MNKPHDTASKATDFHADLITEKTAKRVLDYAGSEGVAKMRHLVMLTITKPNRDQLAEMLLTQPEIFEAGELAAKTYLAHLEQMVELTELAKGRLAAARSYVETLQGKLNKPQDGTA